MHRTVGFVPEYFNEFKGRPELEELQNALDPSAHPHSIVSLSGSPGVGKTRLACEYLKECSSRYELIAWVRCSEEAWVEDDVYRLWEHSGVLGVKSDKLGSETIQEKIHRVLASSSGWLLVFDDATKSDILSFVMPNDENHVGHVIVTSTENVFSEDVGAVSIAVSELSSSVAASILLLDGLEGDVDELTSKLNFNAHSVYLASSYIQCTQCSIGEYMELLESKGSPLEVAFSYLQSEAASGDVTHKFCLDILTICSTLSHLDIPLGIFEEIENEGDLGLAVSKLLELGLITIAVRDVENATITFLSLRSLVQSGYATCNETDLRRDVLDTITKAMLDWAGKTVSYADTVPFLLLPHVDSLLHKCETMLGMFSTSSVDVDFDATWDSITSRILLLLREVSWASFARPLYDTSAYAAVRASMLEKAIMNLSGHHSAEEGFSLPYVALLKWRKGDRAGAQEILLQGKKIQEEKGSNEKSTVTLAQIHHILGVMEYHAEKFDNSLQYCWSAIDTLKSRDERDKFLDLQLASCYSYVGHSFFNQEKYAESLAAYKDALQVHQEVHQDKPHLDIANAMNDVAIVLAQIGRLKESLEKYMTVLEIQRNPSNYGRRIHENVARTLLSIGDVLSALSREKEAISYIKDAIVMMKHPTVYGNSANQNISNCYTSLGIAYENTKEFVKAIKSHQSALRYRQLMYGEGNSHVEIVQSLFNILDCHKATESERRPGRASIWYEKLLNVYEMEGNEEGGTKPTVHRGRCLARGPGFWRLDDDSSVCMKCKKTEFNFLHRRHHCRWCGELICSKCLVKVLVPELQYKDPVNVCKDTNIITSMVSAPNSP